MKWKVLIIVIIIICIVGYFYQKKKVPSQDLIVNTVPPELIIGDVASKNKLDFTIKVISSEFMEIETDSLLKIDIRNATFDQHGNDATEESLFNYMKTVEVGDHVELLSNSNELLSDHVLRVNSLSNLKIGGSWDK
ncbi:hypothetical protein JZO66_10915 [Enterococcus sp. DIV0242_7C1]|uniref:Uncharacterized protein n=1 Tax=Candidatus Enterococcus dunnyi TaxID=1834192 RepID=A0AAQ3W6W0_9ENTE|nr:hypothetical protein [Enterococcus sp. DIV0242_7C1]MBO0471056.1 hypothetical protein [Enterococcus sp. DIV0242_7C1]